MPAWTNASPEAEKKRREAQTACGLKFTQTRPIELSRAFGSLVPRIDCPECQIFIESRRQHYLRCMVEPLDLVRLKFCPVCGNDWVEEPEPLAMREPIRTKDRR
jgi:hypothetical protein